jgi:hypothetical protein
MHVPIGDVGRARLTLEELSKRLEIELTQGTIAELAEDDPLRPQWVETDRLARQATEALARLEFQLATLNEMSEQR